MRREGQPEETPVDGGAETGTDQDLASWGHPRQSAWDRVKSAMVRSPRNDDIPSVDRELARRAIRLGYIAALTPGGKSDWSQELEHVLEREWARTAWPAVRALVRRGWEEGRKDSPDDMSDSPAVEFPSRTVVRPGP